MNLRTGASGASGGPYRQTQLWTPEPTPALSDTLSPLLYSDTAVLMDQREANSLSSDSSPPPSTPTVTVEACDAHNPLHMDA
jgi:hypothetical protein